MPRYQLGRKQVRAQLALSCVHGDEGGRDDDLAAFIHALNCAGRWAAVLPARRQNQAAIPCALPSAVTSALPSTVTQPPAPACALPCVLDIEASGFGRNSYPIEVGFALPDGRTRCTLVRPLPHWTHWDLQAEATHHIQRDTLVRHGRPVAEVVAMLNDELAGQLVYCDGWAHDYPWLAALYEEVDRAPTFRLESVSSLLDEAGKAQLHAAQGRARLALGLVRHRASNDARALQWALGELVTGG